MKRLAAGLVSVSLVALATAGLGRADESAELVINGETEIVTRADAPAHVEGLDEIISGWVFRSDETQALQMDDFDNPGMIFVDKAQEVWDAADGSEGKSCAACHGTVEESMTGVRAVMPKFNEAKNEMYTLEMYVNDCRTERMGAEAWDVNGNDMVEMTALISSVSRGLPINVAIDGPAQTYWEQGKEIYYTRYGLLELSCANCHEDNYGNMIRADHLSQGHVNGFPVYRLKDAKLSSIHNRFKGCIRDTRAETYAPGSPEFIALETYVASRGNGLSVEGPSIRN